MQILWTAPPAAAWPYFYCAEFMNSPSSCGIILLLCRVYEQPLLLQPELIFTVQSLWTVPPAAAWPFYCVDFLNSPSCFSIIFLLSSCAEFMNSPSCFNIILLLFGSLWIATSAAAWPSYCAEFMNSYFCCSLTLLCRVYEQPLLQQPDLFFTVQSLWTASSAAAWALRTGTRGSHPCQPKTQG